ncbi:nucleotide sugar dehydrogenase [Pontixanthobacter aestiaquae]|uniref:Nucleotide sugar dehydrogenase n=1 Tax=Pontixanthobacter aestiaquae TaxID=1509367 RepID=A0A844Z005_9SPHN|nr:nucleotide sugar dehydrogenase [Pontixanthobacter aestiaquae]MDN3646958.1 nucleotide sugar dehydrogenase [Pontixanthobacter aestiaquae]MXO82061.1 nucleotide sugar dehydrogenase [Pontixanthobacter aestiaquae]
MYLSDAKIAVIGLGYVGLPVAVEFGKTRPVLGFDIREGRVAELREGHDETLEVDSDELAEARYIKFSADPADLDDCGVFIVTVPTPIDDANRPDLTPLLKSSETVGKALKKGSVVIYESTVYPGCTQGYCVPVLERVSGLTHNVDFFTGYSPERINPGDKERRLSLITKITSGSTPEVADAIDALYSEIITAGTHKAASIEVAEAAKVIENTQRDVNIALINELAILFEKLGLDTREVLAAAGTKWNFLPFTPGLVGGHCIGVDPYYLTHRAAQVGYHPEMILAGRRVNDGMSAYVADRVVHLMLKNRVPVADAKVLVLGLTFKENCPDLRNSKVAGVIERMQEFNADVDVYDPWINHDEAEHEFGIRPLKESPEKDTYDAVILAVGHHQFADMGADEIRALGNDKAVFFDAKGLFPKDQSDGRL